MPETAEQVYNATAHQIKLIEQNHESARRAALAKLRRGAGKPPGSIPNIWEMTIGALDTDIAFRDRAEWALHIALTLFAVHKQGADNAVSGHAGGSFGAAVTRLRNGANDEAVIRRFNAAVMSDTVEQLSVHARNLIGQMSKIDLDYPKFAKELYYWQFDPNKTRLNWGRDFWKYNSKKQEESNDD